MLEIGTRQRRQPAPVHIVFGALIDPYRAAGRRWLVLLDDEAPPVVCRVEEPTLVGWTSLWLRRPDAQISFEITPEPTGQGSLLRWTLAVEGVAPDSSLTGHLRRRLNQIINADLRLSFGQ